MLKEKDLILKKGTAVDSTIISAPSPTKNKEKNTIPKHILRRKAINGTSGSRYTSVWIKTVVWYIPSKLSVQMHTMLK